VWSLNLHLFMLLLISVVEFCTCLISAVFQSRVSFMNAHCCVAVQVFMSCWSSGLNLSFSMLPAPSPLFRMGQYRPLSVLNFRRTSL
jgi:hypothetical protein